MKPAFFPDWRGETAVVVASGPSAARTPLELARGRARFLAVNSSWKLCPWADVLYAFDAAWWNHARGGLGFEGLKIGVNGEAWPGVETVRCTGRHVMALNGMVGSGGNSGFQAVNLALQFGARRIVLVGFDMQIEGGVHWHGRHPHRMNNPSARSISAWRERLDATAPAMAAMGVEVLNASPVSALTAFPKIDFAGLFHERAAA